MGPNSPNKQIDILHSAYPTPISTIRIIKKKCPDTTILSQVPLYLARYHHPSIGRPTVFGFTLRINALPLDGDSLVAMGLACAPYPTFRLPGWHRGSLAVHSDDGHRYCNDGFGGIEFTEPFSQGDIYTLGLIMIVVADGTPRGMVESEVRFFRNGQRVGSWQVREELEEGRMDPKVGFLGERDVFAALGVTGAKGVEVQFQALSYEDAWRVVYEREPPTFKN